VKRMSVWSVGLACAFALSSYANDEAVTEGVFSIQSHCDTTVVAIAKAQCDGKPISSDDGMIKGILVNNPPLRSKEGSRAMDALAEFAVLNSVTKPEWAVYATNDTERNYVIAIGYMDTKAVPVIIRHVTGWYETKPSMGNVYVLHYDRSGLYAVLPGETGKTEIHLAHVLPQQTISTTNLFKGGKPETNLAELHCGPPSVWQSKGTIYERVANDAVRLYLADGTLKPPGWGLFNYTALTKTIEELFLPGVAAPDGQGVLYDNTTGRCYLFEKGVYQSDGKGKFGITEK